MKRIVEKKMQARKKSSSKVRRAKQREIEPSTHVIERKPRRASGVATELKKQRAKKTVALTKKASTSRGQAKKVGRAVGKISGQSDRHSRTNSGEGDARVEANSGTPDPIKRSAQTAFMRVPGCQDERTTSLTAIGLNYGENQP
jgi:hypothetical protein